MEKNPWKKFLHGGKMTTSVSNSEYHPLSPPHIWVEPVLDPTLLHSWPKKFEEADLSQNKHIQ